METTKKKRPPVKKAQPPQPKRRMPGASAKKPPQKAPHLKERKNAPVQEQVRVTPEVVYLAPKPFSRNRLILRLATVVAVVLALFVALSLFFKVENIQVSGCEQYSAYQIQQASELNVGDQLLTFSRARASGKIISALPYVKTVRIGIRLPDTVMIEVVETKVTYQVEDTAGQKWLMDSDGKIVSRLTYADQNYTKILGLVIEPGQVGQDAIAYQHAQTETDAEGNVVPVTVTQGQKLQTALKIAQYLESYGIIGQAASLDVANLYEIEFWYEDTFQVLIGDSSRLPYKVECASVLVAQLLEENAYATGLIDLTDPEHITYKAFTG